MLSVIRRNSGHSWNVESYTSPVSLHLQWHSLLTQKYCMCGAFCGMKFSRILQSTEQPWKWNLWISPGLYLLHAWVLLPFSLGGFTEQFSLLPLTPLQVEVAFHIFSEEALWLLLIGFLSFCQSFDFVQPANRHFFHPWTVASFTLGKSLLYLLFIAAAVPCFATYSPTVSFLSFNIYHTSFLLGCVAVIQLSINVDCDIKS